MGNATSGSAPSSTTVPPVALPTLPSSSSSSSLAAATSPTLSSSSTSSSSSSSSFVPPEANSNNKDEARLHRLKRPNGAKEKILQEWQKHCLEVCDDTVKAYWICRQEKGFMAPFQCGDANDTMKACLGKCAHDDEQFGAYQSKRLEDMESETLRRANDRIKYLEQRLDSEREKK